MNHRIFAIGLFSALLASSAAHATARLVVSLPLRQALALAQHQYFFAAAKRIEAAEAVPYQSDEEKDIVAQIKSRIRRQQLNFEAGQSQSLDAPHGSDGTPQTMPGGTSN